jgi:O-antigen ligase
MSAPRLADFETLTLPRVPKFAVVVLLSALVITGTVLYAPVLALPLAAVLISAALLGLGDDLRKLFLGSLGALLIGYAFFGRGLAHVGMPPIYVGEMVLGLAILTIISRVDRLKFGPVEWLVVAFMCLGLLRTIPYYGTYGLDAPRDAVLWGYGIFAIAVPLALTPGSDLQGVLKRYQRLLPFFLVWVSLAVLVIPSNALPAGPGSDISILGFKGGDMSVHLAGAAAFIALGLYTERESFRLPVGYLWLAWLFAVGVAGGINRGGLLAATAGISLAFALRPSRRVIQFGLITALVLLFMALFNVEVKLSGDKVASVDVFAQRFESIFKDNQNSKLEGTKEYRLEWWKYIANYTFNGPYFWGGKGFGVNLADSDGFQVTSDGSLRAPHNSHVTVLARMGVPGLVIWVAMLLTFGLSLLNGFFRTTRAGLLHWAGINGWILVYWIAMCINASFDPYLEGPQGGIWFWSIIGLGLFALRAQKLELSRLERAERRRHELQSIVQRRRREPSTPNPT